MAPHTALDRVIRVRIPWGLFVTNLETRSTQGEVLSYPPISNNARIVLERRYLKKDENGIPSETPDDLFKRVADTIGDTEEERSIFYQLMRRGIFMPNSPTLMNAGRPLGQLSACFVLPVPDNLRGIYTTLRDCALIHQSGGGTGFSFSQLRANGSMVKSTHGVASGPVSFMEVYNASTEAIKQGGTRRGANMGILRVDHPNIMDFISCKQDTSKVTNFNISVAITNDFMEAVKRLDYYYLVEPSTGKRVKKVFAPHVFNRIIRNAWNTGEPGVFFIDESNKHNPVPHLGEYEATNPCGEQPLLPYDVCNLGSINVGCFVQPDGSHNYDQLANAIHWSVKFLDNVIDKNVFPLDKIEDLSKRIRRIGLGIMGWADLLVKMRIPYGTDGSIEFAKEFMSFFQQEAHAASEIISEEKGVFPEWEQSVWGPNETCARDEFGERIRDERYLRNCNVTTIAPTGTISMIANCSSGIEPLFAVAFMRNQAGVLMPDINEDFVNKAKNDGWFSEDLMKKIAQEGNIHFPEVPKDIQKIFVTAHDITPEQHIDMQAAFQLHCDSAISKTCNFPASATENDVREIYIRAYEKNCKGVTVYRDGSREEQVLSTGAT